MYPNDSKRIYLAGPDVFYPDAAMRGRAMVRLCTRYGHLGICPMDNHLPEGSKLEQACWIYSANTQLIDSADIVIANLNPFRGCEPDSGTAFEVGYAIAKGKPVYGYLSDLRTLVERHNGRKDKDGLLVEDFDLPINLMLGIPVNLVAGDLNEALARLNFTLAATEAKRFKKTVTA